MYLYKVTNKRLINYFQFPKSITLYLVYECYFFEYAFLFKLNILIQWQIWLSDNSMTCIMHDNMQKLIVWHKKWSTLSCNDPFTGGWKTLSNTRFERKSSSTCNGIMEVTKHGNNILVASIDESTQWIRELKKRHLQY